MPIKELCEGLPKAFADYLTYVRNLGFTEKPDYEYLRALLDKVMKKNGYHYDKIYDWCGKMDYENFYDQNDQNIKMQARRKRDKNYLQKMKRVFKKSNIFEM